MSEFWVSHKKYRCQYCDIFIADDAPSRQQHESGLRHKGNRDRYIRNLYKQGEKQKRDKEDEAREMAMIDKAAHAAYSLDTGQASVAPSALPKPPKPKPTAGPSNPFANYSTAASLGYTDPDADRIALEAQLRQSEGRAGEWTVVAPPLPALFQPQPEPSSSSSVAGQKRSREEGAAVPAVDEEDRSFKVRRKTVAVGLGELWDPGVVKAKVKEQPKEEPKEEEAAKEECEEGREDLKQEQELVVKLEDTRDGSLKPKWVASSWGMVDPDQDRITITEDGMDLRYADPVTEEPKLEVPSTESAGQAVADGGDANGLASGESAPAPAPTAGLFKKRKGAPAGAKPGGRRM